MVRVRVRVRGASILFLRNTWRVSKQSKEKMREPMKAAIRYSRMIKVAAS